MKTFKEFLASKQKQEDRNGLSESIRSMSRLMYHQKYDPFIIIISVERNAKELGRKRYPDDEQKAIINGISINDVNTNNFRVDLCNNHIGFVPVYGRYIETYIDDNGDKVEKKVIERSQIIYTTNDNKDLIMDLCLKWAKKTNQECILYIENGKGSFLYPNDNHKESIGIFYPEKIDEYYSEITPNKTFEFTTKNVSEKIKRYFEIEQDENIQRISS